MLLRIFKITVIAVILWYALPEVLLEVPRAIRIQWQIGHWPHAVFGTAGVCLVAIFCLAVISNFWTFGSKRTNGNRTYALQHKRVLLYAGGSYLLLMLLSLAEHEWRFSSSKSTTRFAVGAVSLFLAAPKAKKQWVMKDKESVYGLQHGRLHLDAHVPMWMNMGYWKVDEKPTPRRKSMAEACRDLLKLVLAEAGVATTAENNPSRFLIDVGFGCGDQTIHLMSDKPIRPCDKLWWDAQEPQVYFDQYVGITQNRSQCQYAEERVGELKRSWAAGKTSDIALFCADAARPEQWSDDLRSAIAIAQSKSQETWLLALDTAYHFSPSRWVLIEHARRSLDASFMAFDLCLSPSATTLQKVSLRLLTTIMGAPWVNFIRPDAYRQKLEDIGYDHNAIEIIDISEHVFAPLAEYMDEQERRLQMLGLGLGSFKAAKSLFRWWGSKGVVRGIVVVARHQEHGR